MILDAETLMPAPQVATLVEGAAESALPGVLKTELHASVVELNTAVASDGMEVLASVQALRAAADGGRARERAPYRRGRRASAGARRGSRHRPGAALPRFRRIRRRLRDPAGRERAARPRRDAGCGGEPARAGRHPSLAPARAGSVGEFALLRRRGDGDGVVPRGDPRAPAAARRAACARLVRGVAGADGPPRRTGLVSDYTAIWWDARIHPKFGTLEIRSPDQPTAVDAHRRVRRAASRRCAPTALAEPRRVRDFGFRVVYDQNRWAASRFGPRATFIHPDDGRAVEVAGARGRAARAHPPVRARARHRGAARRDSTRPLRGRPPARGRPP